MMLNYFHSAVSTFNDISVVYSIDKVILTGKFRYKMTEKFLTDLRRLEIHSSVDTAVFDRPFDFVLHSLGFYQSNKIGSYYNNFNIKLVNYNGFEASCYLGVVLNSSERLEHWKFEFNPNKVFPSPYILKIFDLLRLYTVPRTVKLKSWDLAIDIPLNRLNVSLVRDKRMYQLITKSALDRTEYLGARHSDGFCKLYNKTIESKLDTDITRFEMSLSKTRFTDVISKMPKLLFLQNSQITFDLLSNLSQNQTVFLELLLLHPDYLDKLDKRGKAKYKDCFNMLSDNFVLDKKCVDYLSERLYGYINLEVFQ